MEWIIKANINLVLFGLIYKLIFHLTKQYSIARIYLLVVPVLSMLMPLLLSVSSNVKQSFSLMLDPIAVGAESVAIPATSYSVLDILTLIYFSGAGISLFVSVSGLFKLTFYSPVLTTAYSFFNKMFIPPVSETSRHMMKLHEEAHVRQWHSADILFYQLAKAAFWFNPAVYWLFSWLKEVHEFSADEYAVKHLDDKILYCELLLDETFGVQTHSLINPFHSQSTILNRITMITQNQTQPVSMWKFVALLPLLAAICFLSVTPQKVLAQDKSEKIYQGEDLPEVMPEFKGGQEALIKYLSKEIKYPATAREEKIQGKIVLQFVVGKNGKVSKIKNLKKEGSDPRLVKEAIRVVKEMPDWNPGMDKGKPVAVAYTLPIVFKLD